MGERVDVLENLPDSQFATYGYSSTDSGRTWQLTDTMPSVAS